MPDTAMPDAAMPDAAMPDAAMLDTTADDARALLAAAATRWARPVPNCPGWDAADLVRHTGGIFAWMAAIATTGERVSKRTLDPAPDDPSDLPLWYRENLDRTLGILRAADPAAQTWTFSALRDHRVGWWRRRLAVEVAIHRWDAEQAAAAEVGPPAPVDGEVAAAGIAEFMTEFLPGLLAADGISGLTGSLHLHATDGPSEWWTDLASPAAAVPTHAKADTAVRGTRSDLLLWLMNRNTAAALTVVGNVDVVPNWGQLRI